MALPVRSNPDPDEHLVLHRKGPYLGEADVDRYARTLRPDVRSQFARYCRQFVRFSDGDASREALDRYFAWLRDHYAPSSVRFIWGVLRRLFVVSGVKWPYARYEVPPEEELKTFRPMRDKESILVLIEHAKQPTFPAAARFYLCVATLYGCRRVELQQLRLEHLDTASWLLYVPTRHGGRPRFHLIPEPARWVFADARKVLARPRSLDWFDRLTRRIEAACDFLHVERVGWHSIRRALAYYLAEAGVPEELVEHFMRWQAGGRRMVRRYQAPTDVVGRSGVVRAASLRDQDVDRRVFAVHPFLPGWAKVPSTTG